MGYRHRTQRGKYINFKSKNAYENWKRGMFANINTSNSSKRKIAKAKLKSKRIQHRGVKEIRAGKQVCEMCKKGLPLHKGKCKVCRKETKRYAGDTKRIIADLEKQMDIHAEEWQKLYIRKARQRARMGDHLAFPDEEKLEEALIQYLASRDKIRELDSDYFIKRRIIHDVDVQSGKEFCAMCRAKNKPLTKGKCKVCRQAEKAFAGERGKREREAIKSKMDNFIVDRISGGVGDLIRGKQGKYNTRIVLYLHHANNPIHNYYAVRKVNEITEPMGFVTFPTPTLHESFNIIQLRILGKDARTEAEKHYESLK